MGCVVALRTCCYALIVLHYYVRTTFTLAFATHDGKSRYYATTLSCALCGHATLRAYVHNNTTVQLHVHTDVIYYCWHVFYVARTCTLDPASRVARRLKYASMHLDRCRHRNTHSYVCIVCVFLCACMYTCIHAHACVCVCMYACVHMW